MEHHNLERSQAKKKIERKFQTPGKKVVSYFAVRLRTPTESAVRESIIRAKS